MHAILALAVVAIASATDVRGRSIPRWLTYGGAALGILAHALDSFLLRSVEPLVSSMFTGIACFLFAYLLYRMGAWAGGDAKLFAALGFIIPSYNGLALFPFYALAAAVLCYVPAAFLYVLRAALFSKEFRASARGKAKRWAVSALAFACIFSLLGSSFDPMHAAHYAVFSFLASASVLAFGTARRSMTSAVGAASLRPGMIPAAHYVREGKKLVPREPSWRDLAFPPSNAVVNARLAMGLTPAGIAAIRKAGIRSVRIRKSMPFAPLLLLGIAASIIGSSLFIS